MRPAWRRFLSKFQIAFPKDARIHVFFASHRHPQRIKTPGSRIAVYFQRRSNSMSVDGPVIVAFAALGGSLVGACSSIAATFMGQRLQARWARLRAELEEREKLYGAFVEEAVHLFVDSIHRSAIDPAKIMRLYSKVARIRLTSSERVLRAAEEVGKRLLEAYERPAEDPAEVFARYAKGDEHLDPLREFTEACRQEGAKALKQV